MYIHGKGNKYEVVFSCAYHRSLIIGSVHTLTEVSFEKDVDILNVYFTTDTEWNLDEDSTLGVFLFVRDINNTMAILKPIT